MNQDDTIRLLRECDAGAKMGVSSIDGVLEGVRDQALNDLLRNSKRQHETLGERAAQQLNQLGDEGKEPPLMAKGMSAMKTGMKMMGNEPDRQAADLIVDGCNMGVKSLCRYMNRFPQADTSAKDIAGQLIALEEQLAHDMRPYL